MSNDPDSLHPNSDSPETPQDDSLRELQEEQEALAKLYMSSAWTTGPDGSLQEDRPNWRALTGQTYEESQGFGWRNAVHPDDLEHVTQTWEECVANASPLDLEYRVKQAGGGWRWIQTQGLPLFNAGGQIRKWVGVTSDISKRKSAELAREESEERFRNLADNISQLAWMADEEGWIFWYNQRWYDYTGTSLEAMEGWGWKNVHHPDHVDRVVERFKSCILSGNHWEDTFPLRGNDGKFRWFLSRALPILNEQGEVVRWFGTNTDIDELRTAEEALRESDKRKDEFIATLAHELRNPLAPIRTGLEIMKSSLENPEMLEKLRQTMERQTIQLVSLIDDLLDVSRVTRGKLQLRISRVLLQEVIDSALEATESLIRESGHELHLDLPTEAVYLQADPHRLAQILSNLLNNAAKYTPYGGEIRLRVETIGQDLVLTVQDNGLGIPIAELNAIFDMFRQVDRPSELSINGLGIGLTLVKSLVEQHGGSINARSEGDQQGSTFVVKLPVVETTSTDPAHTEDGSLQPHSSRSFRILVVDDNRDAAETLSIMATLLNHRVATAYSGSEALELGAEFRPEIILMDLGMPEMDGYETAASIRQESWGQAGEVFLIAVTGWGQEQAQRRAIESGFDFHVVKGAEPSVFRELFARIAESS